MPRPETERAITRDQYDAVLFDLDGVITDTAALHAACWKKMLDDFLKARAVRHDDRFRPFDIATDYRLYVDGKLRFDGVRDFLESRGIRLPDGSPDDPPQAETVHGLGSRKNELVNKAIEHEGVQPYQGSILFLDQLRRDGFKTAIVTSSHNCDAVLRTVKLDNFFEARVDGNMVDVQHLAGKPAPDAFLKASELLGVAPARAVVVEDAISGVQAGSNGHFGLVIGVARKANAVELRKSGADLVVEDLSELVH
jgi:beta-phosphoglucomutase family hydrolase